MKKFILDYIKNINKEDIKKFGTKNNIKLSEREINNIYKILQDKNILEYNDEQYYKIIKSNICESNMDKVYTLYIKYKKNIRIIYNNF